MEVSKSKCLSTYAWYFKRKKQDSVWISMCCLDVVKSHSGFYGSKFYMILFLGGVCEPKKNSIDQGDYISSQKYCFLCCVIWNSCVFYPYTTWFTQLWKCFQLIGCTYETDNCKLPEPHPTVFLCCKYFKCLQVFQVAELDTGLEVYCWSSRMQ